MNRNLSTLEGRSTKVATATLAVGLWLCLAATALPADSAPPSRGPQGLPGPRDSSPPPSRGPQGLPGPRDSSPPAAQSPDVVLPPPDGGLGALTIMLISLGGALALTGAGYSITRAARHRRVVS